jgi:hypothetical protein
MRLAEKLKVTLALSASLVLTSLVLSGCENPLGGYFAQEPTPSPSIQPKVNEVSESVKKAKANAELFHEMFLVVMMREPKDRAEFGNWVDTLNQGASLEGVYNGLVHSADYRALEESSPKSSEQTLKAFREEINFLEQELPKPTVLENFGLSSVFVLKRVIGEEALKVIAAKLANSDIKTQSTPSPGPSISPTGTSKRANLAAWYAKWAVHMASRNVDFGIPLRNKPDEAFHLKWALAVTDDQILWEVLNRLHRVLNTANGPLLGAPLH